MRRPFYPPGQDKEQPLVRGTEIKLSAVGKGTGNLPASKGIKRLKGELPSRRVEVKPFVSEEEMDTPLHLPKLLSCV